MYRSLFRGSRRGGRRRRMQGRGIVDLLRRAKTFVKDNQLVSKGLGALSQSGLLNPNLSGYANTAGNIAGALGYGRRRYRGYGLGLAGGRRYGGALRLAGMY